VWIGQSVKVLKGSRVGSGSVVGAGSVLTGKTVASNTSWAGNPARLLRSGVFFSSDSAHAYTDKETTRSQVYVGNKNADAFVYAATKGETLDFKAFEQSVLAFPTASERADFLLAFSRKAAKNRFFIGEATEEGKHESGFWRKPKKNAGT
jgi:predicted RecA/RadA family phage recombinase